MFIVSLFFLFFYLHVERKSIHTLILSNPVSETSNMVLNWKWAKIWWDLKAFLWECNNKKLCTRLRPKFLLASFFGFRRTTLTLQLSVNKGFILKWKKLKWIQRLLIYWTFLCYLNFAKRSLQLFSALVCILPACLNSCYSRQYNSKITHSIHLLLFDVYSSYKA